MVQNLTRDSCSNIFADEDDSTRAQDAVGTETSLGFHPTPVDPGFQVRNHTPQLARAEGIYSQGEEGGRKE